MNRPDPGFGSELAPRVPPVRSRSGLWGPVALLSALFAATLALERALASRDRGTPAEARLVRLHPGPEPLAVAALIVDPPGPELHRYARVEGAWRCLSALNAPARGDRIHELLVELAQAHGLPLTLSGPELSAAGLDPDSAIRLTLLDAGAGAVLALDIGFSLPGPSGARTLVRRVDQDRILEVDAAPRALLAQRPGDALPPLLDRRVLAGTPLERRRAPGRVLLEGPDGKTLELSPGPSAGAELTWILLENGAPAPRPPIPLRVAGYLGFLASAPYQGLAAPNLGLGLQAPTRLTLELAGAAPIHLDLAPSPTATLAPVLNRTTDLTLLVAPELLPLFTPTAAMLTEPLLPNPWEAWLGP